jgi:hypothetical protein
MTPSIPTVWSAGFLHRPARGAIVAATLALLSAHLVACSSVDATKDGAKTAPAGERETEMKHEKCDGESSSAQKTDVNGDGRQDITHVMNGPREVCRIVDLNLDGAVDAFIYYDPQGRERRRESDFDRDGRPDEIAYYEGGVIVRKERETNFDDKLDTWDFYEGGRLARRERDSDGDSIIDQWWQFNNPTNPRCAVVASDRNGDSKPDPDSVVDLCGEGYVAPASAFPGAPPPGMPSAPPAAPGAPAAPTAPTTAPGAPPSASVGSPAGAAPTASAGAPATSPTVAAPGAPPVATASGAPPMTAPTGAAPASPSGAPAPKKP